jgi:hypothetical protein
MLRFWCLVVVLAAAVTAPVSAQRLPLRIVAVDSPGDRVLDMQSLPGFCAQGQTVAIVEGAMAGAVIGAMAVAVAQVDHLATPRDRRLAGIAAIGGATVGGFFMRHRYRSRCGVRMQRLPNYALKLTGAAGHRAILSLWGGRARSLTLFR